MAEGIHIAGESRIINGPQSLGISLSLPSESAYTPSQYQADQIDLRELCHTVKKMAPSTYCGFSVASDETRDGYPVRYAFHGNVYDGDLAAELVVTRLSTANRGPLLGSIVRVGETALQFHQPHEQRWQWNCGKMCAHSELRLLTVAAWAATRKH